MLKIGGVQAIGFQQATEQESLQQAQFEFKVQLRIVSGDFQFAEDFEEFLFNWLRENLIQLSFDIGQFASRFWQMGFV